MKEEKCKDLYECIAEGKQPNGVESERYLLGYILIDPEVLNKKITKNLCEGHFFNRANGLLFQAMSRLHAETGELDLEQLQNALESDGILEVTGGKENLLELADGHLTTMGGSEYHANIIYNKFCNRFCIGVAKVIIFDSFNDLDQPDSIAQAAITSLAAIIKTR